MTSLSIKRLWQDARPASRSAEAVKDARSAAAVKDARGATIVEFALASTLFLTVTFGTIEFGRMILDYNVVSNAAREGVRYAAVRGSRSGRAASATDVAAYVASKSGGRLSPSNVTVTWPTDNAPGSVVQVQVRYGFTPIVTLLRRTAVNLSTTTEANILR